MCTDFLLTFLLLMKPVKYYLSQVRKIVFDLSFSRNMYPDLNHDFEAKCL